jgi:hypothetical protein
MSMKNIGRFMRRLRNSSPAGNYDVGAVAGFIEPAEFNGLAVEFPGQTNGPVVGAIGHEDRGRAMGEQMTRRQFAHLPCSDEIDMLALQRSENLLGEFYRNRGYRNRG